MSDVLSAPLAIGLFYGSTNGDTYAVAQRISSLCESPADPWAHISLHDVAVDPLETMLRYAHLIIGAPTWDVGQLQRDWEQIFDDFDALDLSGRKVALYGLGDQIGYPDTFVDALAFFADKVTEHGATISGHWPAAGRVDPDAPVAARRHVVRSAAPQLRLHVAE